MWLEYLNSCNRIANFHIVGSVIQISSLLSWYTCGTAVSVSYNTGIEHALCLGKFYWLLNFPKIRCWSPTDVFTNLFLNTSFSASLNYSPFMGFIKRFSSFLMWLEIYFYIEIIISRWRVSWNVSTGVTALLHMTGVSFTIIGIYLFLLSVEGKF